MPVPSTPPPPLVCRHFASSPICRPLPAHPLVSVHSDEWIAEQAQPGRPPKLAGLGIVATPVQGDPHDDALPLYRDAADSVVHVIRCHGVAYSDFVCGKMHASGLRVRIPRGAFPQGDSDHHLSVEDDANGREIDFWGATEPSDVPESPIDTLTAGVCPYDGDGSGCSGSTATNIATSLGAVDPHMLEQVETDPHGSLPFAIATTLLCASPAWVFPADFSDGANTNATPACRDHLDRDARPPEGVRYFLDLSDAQIDATANPPYAKAILRTLDREHFGGVVTDTNWAGAPGPALQSLRDGWERIAAEAGLPPGAHGLPLEANGIDLARDLKFCSNGTC
jgi:hypothetical protein